MGAWQEPDGKYLTDPWLDDFRKIPHSLHDEFAAAILQHGKVVEINLEAMVLSPVYSESFKRQYLEYLAELKARHIPLSIGSDCHDDNYAIGFDRAARLLESVGIGENDLWTMAPRAQ